MTDNQTITCADVDAALLDYLEETLDGQARGALDKHIAGCLRCNSLLRDIGSIRSDAAKLPELTPSSDLWAGISARIAPAVVPIERARHDVRRRWMPAAAAAAALIIATAGITYVATSRSLTPSSPRVAGRVPAAAKPPVDRSVASGTEATSTGAASPSESSGSAEETRASRLAEQKTQRAAAGAATLASRSRSAQTSPTEVAYGDEIARLQKIVTERRRELDPSTVSVIEQSLNIIDAAVKQSRAALARDPKSGFLTDQLNHALDKKVDLLRTVALLPSRT